MSSTEKTEVLICGAGPVGLLIALGLAQQGIDTRVFEKRERKVQASFGRASILYPRSIELLEQLDVVEPMTQEGFISSAVFNWRDGSRVTGRGFAMADGMVNTFHDYLLGIRQTNSEDIFHAKYIADFGKSAEYGWALVDYTLDSSLNDGCNVTATVENSSSGEKKTVRSKYIVGADGGQSTVRRISGIEPEGLETEYRWIRVDLNLKTDMPDADLGVGSLETKTHGNVLWQKLNRDLYRIGFVVTPALKEKLGDNVTQEQAVAEAIEAVKPFKVEPGHVEWFTVYTIRQKVAATLHKDDFVLLAGDAAHTHSSAFAQGMNTGIHDATNLIWKLAGSIKGWYKPCVLETYNSERRTAAKQLIEIDQSAAAAISGTIPSKYGGADADANEVMGRIWADNLRFSMGILNYSPSVLNQAVQGGTVHPGTRAPEALVRRPGPRLPVRLQEVTRASGLGRWTVLVFAGYPVVTKTKITALREAFEAKGGLAENRGKLLNLVTLSASPAGNAWTAFGGPAIGRLFFDSDGEAHGRYGFALEQGGIAVIRPDGIFAFGATLDGVGDLENYFNSFCS
ncbi:hypothetical protein GQ53DRAFT_643595 [Thozetella sp. PMI_491]|nr:hypothetical protein GQ53DRAFT_643595 [Thozetella sp. PMI_491]